MKALLNLSDSTGIPGLLGLRITQNHLQVLEKAGLKDTEQFNRVKSRLDQLRKQYAESELVAHSED